METMQFSCGHLGPIPRNMGRGKARQKLLVEYFDRLCPGCLIERLFVQAANLHKLVLDPLTGKAMKKDNGKLVSRPYSQEEIETYVAERSLRLRY